MSNYKIVFVDIDGTVQGPNKHISNNTKKVFKKLKDIGVYVVFCTGRCLGYTYEFVEKCNTSSYLISSNGAEIYDANNKSFIHQTVIPYKSLENIWDIAQKENIDLYLNYDNILVDDFLYKGDIPLKNFVQDKKISQCSLISQSTHAMIKAEKLLNRIPEIEIKNRSHNLVDPTMPVEKYHYFDVSPKDVSKGNAIMLLCKYLNISTSDAIAIGDGINDLSMFQTVGLSIAMRNALDEVKKSCKLVTKDVDNDGVAYILNQIFFNK